MLKLKIARPALMDPLAKTIGIVERRQTMPILSNVLLDAQTASVKLTATDLEQEIQLDIDALVQESGLTTLPARKLYDICRTLPDDADIQLVAGETHVELRAGRSRFLLSCLPATEYPQRPVADVQWKGEIARELLHQLIVRSQFCMAQHDVRYYLNGLLLVFSSNRVVAVATDGHRLATSAKNIQLEMPKPVQVIIPRKGVHEIERLLTGTQDEKVQLEIAQSAFSIRWQGIHYTTKLIDGVYPDYHKVIPQETTRTVLADKTALKNVLARAAILANEKFKGVRLAASAQRLSVQAQNPARDEVEDDIDIQLQGEDIEIGFNVAYLQEAVNAIEGDNVEIALTDAQSSCLIKAPGDAESRYVVMPLRL